MPLSNSWLLTEIAKAGWKGNESHLRTLDQTSDHRLVELIHNRHRGKVVAHILHGFDAGVQFWIRVFRGFDTVSAAIEWLKPMPVVRAEERGRQVLRQGDWFFIACRDFQPTKILTDVHYGRHVIQWWSEGRAKGLVKHCEHSVIFLADWHVPCRCRGWHSFEGKITVHNQSYWLKQIQGQYS